MGDWIRKLFSDSVSQTEKKKGEDASNMNRTQRSDRKRSIVVPKTSDNYPDSGTITEGEDNHDRSLKVISSFFELNDINDLVKALASDLPTVIPFDFGTLRWNPLEGSADEWPGDVEDVFPESINFISRNSALAGTGSIELEGPLICSHDEIWSGGMHGICRARTLNGDPVLIKLHSGLVVPLRIKEKNIGTLSLFSAREEELSQINSDQYLPALWNGLGITLGRIIELDNIKSELERTRELLDSTEDLLVLWKSSGTFWEIECNSKAERFIIREDLSPEMMEGPFFAPQGKEWERGMFAWRKAFDEGQIYQLDLELVTPDGKAIPYLCTFSPYYVDGEILGVKMTGMETESIDKAVTSMGSSNKGYRHLLSSLAHDLKNPLSAISGYAELLNITGDEKRELYALKISQLTGRMARTLEQTQFLSRVQDGKLDHEFHTLDICKVLTTSIDGLQPHVPNHEIHFEPRDRKYEIKGHDLLKHAFTNVLENATKYSDEGSRIDIDITADLKGLNICISDLGSGVPDEHKESIFNKFDRGDVHGGNTGAGLGLAISKSIIELHGGRIWVEDNHPRGSIFKVSLPWSDQ
jgi:signal transduction histidine kinase